MAWKGVGQQVQGRGLNCKGGNAWATSFGDDEDGHEVAEAALCGHEERLGFASCFPTA